MDFENLSCDANGWLQIISALPATVGNGTVKPQLRSKWGSLLRHHRGLFSKAFYSKVYTIGSWFLRSFIYYFSFRFLFDLFLWIQMRACQDDESNPLPSALKKTKNKKTNCDQESHSGHLYLWVLIRLDTKMSLTFLSLQRKRRLLRAVK